MGPIKTFAYLALNRGGKCSTMSDLANLFDQGISQVGNVNCCIPFRLVQFRTVSIVT